MYTVVGYRLSEGEYQGQKYSNWMIYTIYTSDDVEGQGCEVFKVKSSVFPDPPEIGSAITPMYDRWGRIVSLR